MGYENLNTIQKKCRLNRRIFLKFRANTIVTLHFDTPNATARRIIPEAHHHDGAPTPEMVQSHWVPTERPPTGSYPLVVQVPARARLSLPLLPRLPRPVRQGS